MLGSKEEELAELSRKLHNEKLHGIYSSPEFIWTIKLMIMLWEGHAKRM
jgi:hypothetical protein